MIALTAKKQERLVRRGYNDWDGVILILLDYKTSSLFRFLLSSLLLTTLFFFFKKKIITIIPHANCRNEQFDGSKPDLGILLFHEIQNLKFAGAVLGHRALFPTNL